MSRRIALVLFLLALPLAAHAHGGHGEHEWRDLIGHPLLGVVELLCLAGAGALFVLFAVVKARRAARGDSRTKRASSLP